VLATYICLNLPGTTSAKTSFKSFKKCLITKNVDSTRIVHRRNGSKTYRSLNYQWQLRLSQIYALAYVLPLTESDVTATVACGHAHGVRLLPRSGGHSFEKYSFADKDSVVVDLRRMDEVKQSGMTVVLGPGVLIGPTAIELWNSGKVFIPAGSCPSVGIAGLALGGGYGFFLRQYGLTTDNILEMNIVTATKGLITVNTTTNSDLYWALRGAGGGNFGIVTKFVLRLYSAPPTIFVGILKYSLESFQEFFAAFQSKCSTLPRPVTIKVTIARGVVDLTFVDISGSSTSFETFQLAFPKSRDRSTKTYDYPDFLFYQATNFTEPLRSSIVFESSADFGNIKSGSAGKIYSKVKSFFVQRLLLPKQISLLNAIFRKQPETVGVAFFVWGGAVYDLGDTETSFVHRQGNLYLVAAEFQPGPNSSTSGRATGQTWLGQYFEMGKYIFNHKESYQNYVDGDLSDYLERYYGRNLPALVEIKRKYDQSNYFRFPQSIPF